MTGPEQDLPQALALLQSACDRFEHSCVEKVMLLEKHKAAAFTDPAAGATAQLLLQRMQSVGQQRGVLIQMGTASTSSGSKPVFNGVKVHVSTCPGYVFMHDLSPHVVFTVANYSAQHSADCSAKHS